MPDNEQSQPVIQAEKPGFIQSLLLMPRSIPFIVGNEAAERFSFYGMKAILATFMTTYLLDANGKSAFMGEEEANKWIHYFNSAVYFTPIIGAIMADWLFGKYRVILYVSLLYCVGHALLACIDLGHLGIQTGIEPRTFLFLGLICISLGAGGIKPCVSTNVGDQFDQKNKFLIPIVFSLFYFAINFGSFFSTLLMPSMLKNYGPGWAFGIPGILMGIATFIFWVGTPHYKRVPPAGSEFFVKTFSWEGIRALSNLIPLFIFIAMFWALFDQTASAWVHQADKMDRMIGNFELLPAQVQAANPLLVMFFIPIFSLLIYPALGKLIEVSPLRKIGMGMFLTIPSFIIPAWIENQIDLGVKVHVYWHVIAYLFLTAAEVMISITALEFSYTQAPPSMKSIVMGFNLMSVSIGNFFVGYINHMIEHEHKIGNKDFLTGADYYWFFTACMLVTAIIYVAWSFTYKGRTYIQGETTTADPS